MSQQPARVTVVSELAEPDWHPTIEHHGMSYVRANELVDALIAETLAPVMRIVCDYVIESNDVGGLDCNDLADRLRAAGYPLPDDEDADEAASLTDP